MFEVGDAEGHFVPPPDADKAYRVVRQGDLWLPVREIRHSLPAERDAFVGRHEALADLSRRIQSGARLVSVLGIGGTGKTRLVTRYRLELARRVPRRRLVLRSGAGTQRRRHRQRGGAGARRSAGPGRSGRPASAMPSPGRGRCLVILDNFEQVARHAEPDPGPLAGPCRPGTLRGHDARGAGAGRRRGAGTAAVAARRRADAVRAACRGSETGFPAELPKTSAAIAPLVALLDGLPLAIELAAARVRVMPPRTLLRRMSERFKLLASKGGRHDRQSTLRAAFDWSWDLLSPAEKAALAQLSVFEGGFTLEAAEAVLDSVGIRRCAVDRRRVHALVDKSFVRQRDDERFDLLVSVQVYAAEHLQTAKRYAGSGAVGADSRRSGGISDGSPRWVPGARSKATVPTSTT